MGLKPKLQRKQPRVSLFRGPSIREQWGRLPWWLKLAVVAVILAAIAGAATIEPSGIPVIGKLFFR
jgi:hypothetical protein